MDIEKIELLEDNILVKPDSEESTTKSGLIIIKNETAHVWGTVLAVGDGITKENVKKDNELVPGDRILFGKTTGTPVLIEQQKYLIMYERDVILKMEA